MSGTPTNFTNATRRINPWAVAAIILLHVAILYFLVRSFAPNSLVNVERSVVSAFTVTVTAPEEETPAIEAEPEPEQGYQGEPGKEAIPKPVAAPTPKVQVRQDRPVPRASSDGDASTSGATESGDGTGAAGDGLGTGAGSGGDGQGGGAATKPVLVQSISDSSSFPIPPGGRNARIGKSVIVRLSVSAEGRVTGCNIYRASPFPATDARVCELSYQNIRFEPARDTQGNPVASSFLYRQRFFN